MIGTDVHLEIFLNGACATQKSKAAFRHCTAKLRRPKRPSTTAAKRLKLRLILSMENERLNSLWSLIAGSEVLCVRSSQSGNEIAVGTITSCLVLDTERGSKILDSGETQGRITSVAFTEEGNLLVGGQGRLQLWDVQSSTCLKTLQLREDTGETESEPESVFLAQRPDGQLFGVASELGRQALDERIQCFRDLATSRSAENQPATVCISIFRRVSPRPALYSRLPALVNISPHHRSAQPGIALW